jgi:cytochrome c peroxidase
VIGIVALLAFAACKYDKAPVLGIDPTYQPTPYDIDSATPSNFPPMQIPADNPLTREGVSLGRRLFYDPILSGDNTMSCASCHQQQFGFTDGGKRFSMGIDGVEGTRNSMTLFNVGYGKRFFWDGRAMSLEEQVLMPIQDVNELHETLPNLVGELQSHPEYPELFKKAFGTSTVTPELIGKAIAQFERILISGNSPYDRRVRGEGPLEDMAYEGFKFITTLEPLGGDCLHCHSDGNMMWGNFTYNDPVNFSNNALDSSGYWDFPDLGRGAVTGDSAENGRFKIASLRNSAVTGPYMHDGRFATLEDVVEHYSNGLKPSPTVVSGNMNFLSQGGGQFSQLEKDQIIAFLNALTDTAALHNPEFGPP